MKKNDLIQDLTTYHSLNENQERNLNKIVEISNKFHEEADLGLNNSLVIDKNTIVLESSHQPNFIPYPGTFKKAFLLDWFREKIGEQKGDAIALYGFLDQNLSTASLLYQNQIPGFKKNREKENRV